jgi:stage V sporulation protein SpoVS
MLLPALVGCGSNNVSSNDDARRAYLGLDGSIDKAIDLGFVGFNAAQSANIPPEAGAGAMAGTLTVTGQVDQGVSANKQMRLNVAMAGYRDVRGFTYDTDAGADGGAALPALDMSLQGIPTGTLTGTLAGTFHMSGDLSGPVTLALMFTGDLAPNPDGGAAAGVVRKPGTTHITGTATSPAGTFTVDVTK